MLTVPFARSAGRITTFVLGSDAKEDLQTVNPTTVFDPDTPKVVHVSKAAGATRGALVRSA